MKSVAEVTNGVYYEPSEINKLKLLFGETPAERCEKEHKEVQIVDNNHWITKSATQFQATLGGYNFVVPKTSGRKMLATDCGRSIMIAGRLGLGRTVVISTDDGTRWAGQFYSRENSKTFTRAMNWAIGDFLKDKDGDIRTKDTYQGEPTTINMVSIQQPQIEGFTFSKVDAGKYTSTLAPESAGFVKIQNAYVGINSPEEYFKLGISKELQDLVTVSGGQVFNPNNVEQIRDAIVSMSRRVKLETVTYRLPAIIAALLLLLIDILFRRIRESKRG